MSLEQCRDDFPALQRTINGQPLAYLDNAATTQKPQAVIDAVSGYYEQHNANVHRCVHTLGEEATERYDAAHETVGEFIGAPWDQVAFTKNTTEALNAVAHAYGQKLSEDDEIVLTEMEHHSMIVPWQRVAEQTGATIRYVPVQADGTLDMDELKETVGVDTPVVGCTQVSNVLGTVNPVDAVADIAHDHDAICVVDGAQSVPHTPVDVDEMGADFLAFSGHKLCGPTGIGALYGRRDLLEDMDPYMTGGGMIRRVTKEGAAWNELPWKFEAGTPHIAGGIGLAAAIDYLEERGMDAIEQHSRALAEDLYQRLEAMEHVTVYGPADRLGLASFTVDNAHPHDLSSLLNEHGIAIRGGHHCAQPLAERLDGAVTARASVYLYNTMEELDLFENALEQAVDVFNG